MAIRDDFTAGEVLAAADLNDTFASKVPYAYGTATPSTTVDGFVWYDENETPPAPKFWDGAAFQALGGGKVLQVVRATDTTLRTTNSTSFVDVTGMSVTITPQKSTSAIIIIAQFVGLVDSPASGYLESRYAITDSSNNNISGAQTSPNGTRDYTYATTGPTVYNISPKTMIAYATPATTSATTYKLRHSVVLGTSTSQLLNQNTTGQMFAIEVSA